MPVSTLIINAVLFQVAWFTALYGGVYEWLILAVLPASAAAIWHLYVVREHYRAELVLFLSVVILGFVIESAFITLGTIVYVGAPLFGFGPPLWILAMWLAFATLPHGCLNWLRGKWLLQIVLGGLTGPLSYLAGGQLGGATLPEPVFLSLAIIGVGWAIALPLIFWLADRSSGRQNSA